MRPVPVRPPETLTTTMRKGLSGVRGLDDRVIIAG
jgi:hypothetical protein